MLVITAENPVEMPVRLRIPYWTGPDVDVKINGKKVEGIPSPGSYMVLNRVWRNGDRISMDLPMHLHLMSMPDEPTTKAVLYGPLVLAGQLGSNGITREMVIGPLGPDLRHHAVNVPTFRATGSDANSWIKPVSDKPLTFQTTGQSEDITLVPFDRVFGQRYSIYWTMT